MKRNGGETPERGGPDCSSHTHNVCEPCSWEFPFASSEELNNFWVIHHPEQSHRVLCITQKLFNSCVSYSWSCISPVIGITVHTGQSPPLSWVRGVGGKCTLLWSLNRFVIFLWDGFCRSWRNLIDCFTKYYISSVIPPDPSGWLFLYLATVACARNSPNTDWRQDNLMCSYCCLAVCVPYWSFSPLLSREAVSGVISSLVLPSTSAPQCLCRSALLKGNSQSFLLTTTDLLTSTPELALLSAITSSSFPFYSFSLHSYSVSQGVFFSDASHLLFLLFSCIFTSLSLPCVGIYMAQSHLRITKLKYPVLSTIVSSSPNLSISSHFAS